MTRIEKSITIGRPIKEVFAYAADYTKWEKWFEGVSDFQPIKGSGTENGTLFAYKAKMLGLKMQVETEIFDFEENKGWKGKGTKGITSTTFWKFSPENGDTNFTYALEYDFAVPLFGKWLDDAFMKPKWNEIIADSLKNLKHQLEKTSPDFT